MCLMFFFVWDASDKFSVISSKLTFYIIFVVCFMNKISPRIRFYAFFPFLQRTVVYIFVCGPKCVFIVYCIHRYMILCTLWYLWYLWYLKSFKWCLQVRLYLFYLTIFIFYKKIFLYLSNYFWMKMLFSYFFLDK